MKLSQSCKPLRWLVEVGLFLFFFIVHSLDLPFLFNFMLPFVQLLVAP